MGLFIIKIMKRKILALLATFLCTVLIEAPDIIPLVDEALLMFIIVRVWSWAGVDLLSFFGNKSASKPDSEIIEID